VGGNRDDILKAERQLAERGGALDAHEDHLAQAALLGLRLAVKRYPDSLSDWLSEVPVVVQLAEAVVALEDRGVRS
jgi:hypothetical protein